jgi:hypothetical protein
LPLQALLYAVDRGKGCGLAWVRDIHDLVPRIWGWDASSRGGRQK